jgi:hypothetical protein
MTEPITLRGPSAVSRVSYTPEEKEAAQTAAKALRCVGAMRATGRAEFGFKVLLRAGFVERFAANCYRLTPLGRAEVAKAFGK